MWNKKRHQVQTEIAQAHRVNLQRNWQRRMESARAKGDETLIRLLEAEASYIGLN